MAPRTTTPADPMVALAQQLASLSEQVRGLASLPADLRETREGVIALRATLETQNVPAQLAELKASVEAGDKATAGLVSDLRADVVNAFDKEKARVKEVTDELDEKIEAVASRVTVLEGDKNKAMGVAQFFGWLTRVTPWLFSGIAAFLAGLGWKDRIGG